jgi:hypothetical protein
LATTDLWTYRQTTWTGTNLTGFEVEATDGDIGKVDDATDDVGGSFIVVDTGPWIFGKKVMLPAGVISDVDFDAQKVFVNRTKDEIKNAPGYDADRHTDPAYRDEIGTYYGGGMSYGAGTTTAGGTTARDDLI